MKNTMKTSTNDIKQSYRIRQDMSGAEVYIPIETTTDQWDNQPCWCAECGWDGVEDDLQFTNEGVFVCPQCSSEDTDYYYSEEAESCVFCGSDKVVGVIDVVSFNEIHEATPLDKEQVYGYCARCADVKMAEGSTGDQIISWEDGAGVSSPSMPPADIFWSESKKERIASGRKMHYAIPSEKKYPIWDKAHARMALAWSRGTKYADKVEKAVSKRFPSMAAESWAAEFAALGEPDAPYDQGYDDQQDESIGERNITTGEQSLKDRRDEADAMDKKMGRKYDDVATMDAEEVPVVPDPSSFPSGYGRVLGQQTDQANLSPLHAEGDDVQKVKIQDPVTTGAKLALGVVALNATAIAGAALIGLAISHTAKKEEQIK